LERQPRIAAFLNFYLTNAQFAMDLLNYVPTSSQILDEDRNRLRQAVSNQPPPEDDAPEDGDTAPDDAAPEDGDTAPDDAAPEDTEPATETDEAEATDEATDEATELEQP
jgi:hypothetical protein